ncbi:MAG: amidohydrolase family protein [Planctomycetota bacterium]|nr:amidohydrolase family protein [Planctomycetota bacterium]
MDIIARRYDTLELVCIRVEDGQIRSIQPQATVPDTAEAPWVAPGLVDIQVNGCCGRDFLEPGLSVGGVAEIGRAVAQQGVTGYCPTITTHSFARLAHAARTIARACEEDRTVAVQVVGIHREGPYISGEDGPRGAHPREHVRPPDWEEFQRLQEAAGGRIRILTLSPEYASAADFAARVAKTNVIVAIGHTGADSAQIRAAVDAGAKLSTHLGNGAHGQIRRHPNYLWDQLAEDRLTASLIVDGHHLPPTVVKVFVRAKSLERCLLISDLTGLAGRPPGRYEASSLGAVEVLEDGRLVVAGQRQLLAGAALPLTVGITNLMRFTGASLQTAVDLASLRPAAFVGVPARGLKVGAPADLVLFHLSGGVDSVGQLEVLATCLAGQILPRDAVLLPSRRHLS